MMHFHQISKHVLKYGNTNPVYVCIHMYIYIYIDWYVFFLDGKFIDNTWHLIAKVYLFFQSRRTTCQSTMFLFATKSPQRRNMIWLFSHMLIFSETWIQINPTLLEAWWCHSMLQFFSRVPQVWLCLDSPLVIWPKISIQCGNSSCVFIYLYGPSIP
jgi:hypothetical protein